MASIRIGSTAELALLNPTGTGIGVALVGTDAWAWDPSSVLPEDANTLGTFPLGRWRLGMYSGGDPSIVGVPIIGDTLSVANAPGGATYQWTRDGVDISGETSATYLCVKADIGPTPGCKVNGVQFSGTPYTKGYIFTRLNQACTWREISFSALANGAVSQLSDQTAELYNLVGSGASIDTSVGGKKTLVLNGSGGFDSANPAAWLGGALGASIMCCLVKVGSLDLASVVETGDMTAVGGVIGIRHRGASNQVQYGTNYGAGGGTRQSAFYTVDTMATAAVRSFESDTRNHHPMADFHYVNGTKVVTSTAGYTGNASAGADTLDGTKTLSIGQRLGGTNRWSGKYVHSITIYNRQRLPRERVHEELLFAYDLGISTASMDATVPAFAGYAIAFPGQSNSKGYDAAGYPGTQPATWPDADVAPLLFEVTGDQTTSPTVIPLQEPVNGAGGTHYVSYLSELCRASGYGSTTVPFACIPGPPLDGSPIVNWQKGAAANLWSGMMKKIWFALRNGWDFQALNMYQGETDGQTINPTYWPLFAARTSQFLSDTATYSLRPNLRALLHRLHATQPPTGFDFWPQIRVEVDNVTYADYIVSDASGTLMGDQLHLTTDAQRAQGYTDATAFLAEWPTAAATL